MIRATVTAAFYTRTTITTTMNSHTSSSRVIRSWSKSVNNDLTKQRYRRRQLDNMLWFQAVQQHQFFSTVVALKDWRKQHNFYKLCQCTLTSQAPTGILLQQHQQYRYMGVSVKHRSPYRVNEKVREEEDKAREKRTEARIKMNERYNNASTKQALNLPNKYKDKVKLQLCHSDYDLFMNDEAAKDEYDIEDDEEEDTEEFMYHAAEFDVHDITDKVEEMFDTTDNIQYYDETNQIWKAFPSTQKEMVQYLSKYRHGKIPLKVRVPEIYDTINSNSRPADTTTKTTTTTKKRYVEEEGAQGEGMVEEEDYDEVYDEDEIDDDENDMNYSSVISRLNNGMKLSVMEDTIYDLVKELQKNHYIRSPTKPNTMILQTDISSSSNNNNNSKSNLPKEILTKEWLIQQASTNPKIEAVIMGHVGSIDHIVQCLHYDMVWNKSNNEISFNLDHDDDDNNNIDRQRIPRLRSIREIDDDDVDDYHDTMEIMSRQQQRGRK